jgi:hypothetical protein
LTFQVKSTCSRSRKAVCELERNFSASAARTERKRISLDPVPFSENNDFFAL